MNRYFHIVFIIGFACLFLVSCDSNNVEITEVISCDDGVQNGDETGIDCGGSCREICPPENAIQGELVSVLELTDEKEHILSGPLIIRDGGALIIQAGTVIKAQRDRNAYIAVTQGGKLFIYGREDNPVTITSNEEDPMPGDWGGILLFGKAPINSATVDRSDLLDYFYGGTDPDDSSGLLRYLRLEYAGMNYNESLNFNGITLFGVGRFTTMNHVQINHSNGDGLRIVGGTITPERIVLANTEHVGLVLTDGWQGTINSSYIYKSGLASLQFSNNSINTAALPLTSGQLSDMSLLSTAPGIGVIYNNGGAAISMNDIYTSGLETGILVDGSAATMRIDSGSFIIDPIFFTNNSANFTLTNYTGSSYFIVEGQNLGAGNLDVLPVWAQPWTLPF